VSGCAVPHNLPGGTPPPGPCVALTAAAPGVQGDYGNGPNPIGAAAGHAPKDASRCPPAGPPARTAQRAAARCRPPRGPAPAARPQPSPDASCSRARARCCRPGRPGTRAPPALREQACATCPAQFGGLPQRAAGPLALSKSPSLLSGSLLCCHLQPPLKKELQALSHMLRHSAAPVCRPRQGGLQRLAGCGRTGRGTGRRDQQRSRRPPPLCGRGLIGRAGSAWRAAASRSPPAVAETGTDREAPDPVTLLSLASPPRPRLAGTELPASAASRPLAGSVCDVLLCTRIRLASPCTGCKNTQLHSRPWGTRASAVECEPCRVVGDCTRAAPGTSRRPADVPARPWCCWRGSAGTRAGWQCPAPRSALPCRLPPRLQPKLARTAPP